MVGLGCSMYLLIYLNDLLPTILFKADCNVIKMNQRLKSNNSNKSDKRRVTNILQLADILQLAITTG